METGVNRDVLIPFVKKYPGILIDGEVEVNYITELNDCYLNFDEIATIFEAEKGFVGD